jgi:hypothetical protein
MIVRISPISAGPSLHGQRNNDICYFKKLGSHIRQQLFDAHCIIVYLAVSFGHLITPRSTRFVLLGVALSDIHGFSLVYDALC